MFKKAWCWRCELKAQTAVLLDSGDGTVRPGLDSLASAIGAMKRPNSGVTWLRNPKVKRLLHDLGTGRVDLTHESLDELRTSTTVEYIRDLLVSSGALPPRDRLMIKFEFWLEAKLDEVEDLESQKLIRQFATWHHLRKMRGKPGDTSTNTFLSAKQSTTVAINFLEWLGSQNVELGDCNQAMVDAWFASGPSTRQHAERFIYWGISQRLIPRSIEIPRRSNRFEVLLSEDDRVVLLRRILTVEELPLHFRVAGGLVVLLGQAAQRICEMTVDHVRTVDSGQAVEIKLGADWLRIPEPFGALLLAHLANRPYMSTAANPTSPWLFPSYNAGRHMTPTSMTNALRAHGIKTLAARNRARRNLVTEAPSPVIAQAIGISPETATRHATLAGMDYAGYPGRTRDGGDGT